MTEKKLPVGCQIVHNIVENKITSSCNKSRKMPQPPQSNKFV